MIGVAESIKRVLGDYIYTCTCMCRPTKRVLGDYIYTSLSLDIHEHLLAN